MQPTNKTFKVVEIVWVDIQGSGEWASLKSVEAEEPTLCTSVGYELPGTAKWYRLAGDISVNDDGSIDVANYNIIPKTCILHKRILKKG